MGLSAAGRVGAPIRRYHDVSADDDEIALSAMFQGVKNPDKNVAIEASHDKNDDSWLSEMDDEGKLSMAHLSMIKYP